MFANGNSSSSAHGQEHMQVIVTLRSGRQVDKHVVDPEVDTLRQEGEESGNKEERDAEPSIATPIVKDPPRLFVPKAPYPERLQVPRKEGSLRTSWRCSRKSKLIFHFWTPSSKYLYMPSS